MNGKQHDETLSEYVDRTLRSLEPSHAELTNHNCAQHPQITHERWLQCQHEIRAILVGETDLGIKAT